MKAIEAADLNFADLIHPGDTVCWGQGAAEPLTLTETLMAQRHRIGGRFNAFIGIGFSDTAQPEHCDVVNFRSYCGTGTNRRLVAANALDIFPGHYSAMPAALKPDVDVLLLQLAPTKTPGVYSFGLACEYLYPLITSARLVVAEINENAPMTCSDWKISEDDIDITLYTSRPLVPTPSAAVGPVDAGIAANVADIIGDGATIQVGLGGMPAAILGALSGHKDLGVHSGMINDALVNLIQSGAVTNARKNIDTGVSIGGMLTGSRETYAFCHENQSIRLAPTSHTHAQSVLCQINKFTAINSAIEVDLSGQVNAETAAGRYVGAIGGGTDFLRGAAASDGGLPIVALPASLQKRDGTRIGKIVAKLSGPVSTSRADAGVIVTEYGIADLRGLTLSQRRSRMIAIAHPELREALEQAQ